jgi:hypothetical protein
MGTINYGALAAEASKGFAPIPIGPYDVEVTGAEFKVASTGKPMYKVEFTIANGPNKGRKVWTNLVMTLDNPNAMGAFFGKMRALGLGTEFFAALPAENAEGVVCQTLIGRPAIVTVKHRDYNGQAQNDVDKISARVAVTPTAPDVQTITPTDVAVVPAAELPSPQPTAVATGTVVGPAVSLEQVTAPAPTLPPGL